MRIAIITIHAMHNPGSVFQAYALQTFLNQNYQAEIIDYRPPYFYSEKSKLKLFAKKILHGKSYSIRSGKFDGFIKNNMKLTEEFSSYESLKSADLPYDVFIAGSDQLWNTDYECGNDDAFYLQFTDGKKISYSTSVGKTDIDEKNRKVLQEKLPSFQHLSVREKKTADDLSLLLNMDVRWVCDPVFLLNAEHYSRFIKDEPPIGEPYAVVYLCPESDLLNRIVEYYRSQGLKIILAGGFTKRCECDYHFKDTGPLDFLNLIYHSKVVVSKSFHATAFCHIFHKDFVTIIPPKNGERINSLLTLSGLSSRGVTDSFDPNAIDVNIDWDEADKKLQDHIDDSKDYIDLSLGS